MSLINDMKRAVREMGRRMGPDGRTPRQFTWTPTGAPAVAVDCVSSSLGREVVIDPEGNDVAIDLKLLVDVDTLLAADGNAAPVSGTDIIFEDVTYQIVTAKKSGPQSHWEWTLRESR